MVMHHLNPVTFIGGKISMALPPGESAEPEEPTENEPEADEDDSLAGTSGRRRSSGSVTRT